LITAPTNQPDWATIRASTNRLLDDHHQILDSFRSRMTALFTALLVGKEPPYVRRPTASLRLVCDGIPSAKLVVHPAWNAHRKTVNVNVSRTELLQESRVRVKGENVLQFRRCTVLITAPDQPPCVALAYSTMESDITRVLRTMEDFVTDYRAVLARNHDHCCVCGKALTDTLSRSRGIGPECIRHLDWFGIRATDGNQLVVPEMEPRP
jgi:hypothetical protein